MTHLFSKTMANDSFKVGLTRKAQSVGRIGDSRFRCMLASVMAQYAIAIAPYALDQELARRGEAWNFAGSPTIATSS